tara:strand:- start:454 stop:966 length:513 start_codon:yes stop_codon:yes gene_type:complete
MDLKKVLHENQEEKSDVSIRKHKKPIQLRDIENRSSNNRKSGGVECESDEQIKELLEKEKEEIYKQSWNKLDNGLKINRLKKFIENETIEKGLSDEKTQQLTKILIGACRSNKLNKNTDVVYDKDSCQITNIRILKYEKNKYHLEIADVKKSKPSGKSKSNIERLLKSKN